MRKLLILIIALLSLNLSAQQDAMFTKYMFNGLNYNPAYAGSSEVLDITLLHRHQWWGIKGAPITQNLTVHAPLLNKKIALGASLIFDQIGVSKQVGLTGSYAYRIPIGKGKLAFGLQAQITNWRSNFNKLDVDDPEMDMALLANMQPSFWLPNFGFGLYYESKRWFLGAAAPRLLENDLRKEGISSSQQAIAQQYRHYFLMGGLAIPFNSRESIVFRPSFLLKSVDPFSPTNQEFKVGAPNEIDIDLSLLFNKVFWVGLSYRTALESSSTWDSADIWMSFLLKNGFRFGVAYDYTLTELRGPGQGTYEIMLGYDFRYTLSRIRTPRYF